MAVKSGSPTLYLNRVMGSRINPFSKYVYENVDLKTVNPNCLFNKIVKDLKIFPDDAVFSLESISNPETVQDDLYLQLNSFIDMVVESYLDFFGPALHVDPYAVRCVVAASLCSDFSKTPELGNQSGSVPLNFSKGLKENLFYVSKFLGTILCGISWLDRFNYHVFTKDIKNAYYTSYVSIFSKITVGKPVIFTHRNVVYRVTINSFHLFGRGNYTVQYLSDSGLIEKNAEFVLCPYNDRLEVNILLHLDDKVIILCISDHY
jgi:hypothetical protein